MITIIGVVLLAFLVFFVLSQNQSIEVQKSKDRTEAANTVSDLALAAKTVYSQGIGAKKKVLIKLPNGYDRNRSSIEKRAIRINVDGNDYVETLDFQVEGSLPQTPGVHWVWVSSTGGKVRIGNSLISLSRLSINSLMPRDSSISEAIVVTSVWDNPINVSIQKSFFAPQMSLSLDREKFTIDPLESIGVNAMFVSQKNASGFNSGSLQFLATDGFVNETVSIPITVEVSANTSSNSFLSIIPGELNISANPNQNYSASFQICSKNELSGVSFNSSATDAGAWISSLDPLGPIKSDQCRSKTFTLTIPKDASDGLYNGYIFANALGSRNERSTIYLEINVSRWASDHQGPDISSLMVNPRKPYSSEPIVISAHALDNQSRISQCLVSMDSGSWFKMYPVDGLYDNSSEHVRYTFFSGLDKGPHSAAIRCSDEPGNSNQAIHSFDVMKEILFVTKSNSPGVLESDWINWIRAGRSWEGNTWSIDVVKSGDLISGTLDQNYYSTLVAAKWDNGLASAFNNHLAQGGSIILLGEANVFGPRSLGFASSIGDKIKSSQIYIVDNESYITSPFPKEPIQVSIRESYIYYAQPDGVSVLALDTMNRSNPMLWIKNGITSWGFNDIAYANFTATNISMRVLDYSINRSTIIPG
jgi:hypothetical protein